MNAHADTIATGLSTAATLIDSSTGFDVLSTKLPIVNKSLGEVINTPPIALDLAGGDIVSVGSVTTELPYNKFRVIVADSVDLLKQSVKAGDSVEFRATDGSTSSLLVKVDSVDNHSLVVQFPAVGGRNDGTIGMIQISQARQNGRLRTGGFEKAMNEAGYKVVAKNEMRLYTADETFKFAQDMLTANPELRGIFVEAANASLGALRAIQASRRSNDTLLVAFDGLPQFVDLIKQGDLVASAMQQPYLMGFKAAEATIDSIEGKPTQQTIALPVLIVTKDDMDQMLPVLQKTVFPAGSVK